MNSFLTERDAKAFLVSRIIAEAKREGVPLSELERKMLSFSEGDGDRTRMLEISEAFERECDDDAFEEKIAGIVRSIYARDDGSDEEITRWADAVTKLGEGDHYLLVLIDGASRSPGATRSSLGKFGKWLPSDKPRMREPGDRMRLILVALGVLAVLLIGMVVASRLR